MYICKFGQKIQYTSCNFVFILLLYRMYIRFLLLLFASYFRMMINDYIHTSIYVFFHVSIVDFARSFVASSKGLILVNTSFFYFCLRPNSSHEKSNKNIYKSVFGFTFHSSTNSIKTIIYLEIFPLLLLLRCRCAETLARAVKFL